MPIRITHSKGLSSPDSGAEDKIYGVDYVSTGSHTISGYDTTFMSTVRTTTTTSSLPIAELSFNIISTSTYAFEFGLAFASALSTTGIRIGLNGPTYSTLAVQLNIPHGTANTANLAMAHGWLTSFASSIVTSSAPANSEPVFAQVYGIVKPTSTGILQLTYATEVAGSAISTFAGSYGILTNL